MTPHVTRALPWCPEDTRLALAGRVVVSLRSGTLAETIPSQHDVRSASATPHPCTANAAVDKVLRRHSFGAQIARVFSSARHANRAGRRHLDFDALEDETGLSRTLRIDVDPDACLSELLDDLRALEVVERASPCYLSEAPFAAPASARASRASHSVGAEEALAMEPGDSTLIIAVVDSGVDLEHPELRGRLRPGFDGVDLPPERASRRIRFVGDTRGRDRVPQDEQGHGTACAGIIGAIGIGGERGLAGAAQLLPIRALAAARSLDRNVLTAIGSIPDIDASVKLAVDLGARVLNLSFGTPETALREGDAVPHAAVVRYALARECVLVAASGNDGRYTKYFPAALPGVIAVGASDGTGPAAFSTRGDHVALCAPGVDVRAPKLSGGYAQNTGTSFAAPFVTAAAALVLARAARLSVGAPASLVRDILVRSAAPFGSPAHDGCGGGVLNVPAALRRADQTFRQLTYENGAQEERGPEIPARPSALMHWARA